MIWSDCALPRPKLPKISLLEVAGGVGWSLPRRDDKIASPRRPRRGSSLGNQQAETQDYQAELTAAIARLNVLLQEAAADAQAVSGKVAAVEAEHARELSAERDRTAAARADTNELQHRMKNILATVQAIANATLRPDVSYDHARAAFNSRLAALSHVQDLLFERNWSDAKLKSLVDAIVAPHVGGGSERLRVQGPDIAIGPRTALVLALALNELATNALKHGALSNSAGYVEVAWTRETEFGLRWHERNGPPVTVPSRKGFGSRLLTETLPAQLDATVELEFDPRGLICSVRAPAQELSA